MRARENAAEKERYNVYKRKLRINDECGLGRKLEKVEEFNESYFRDNYYDAFVLTRKILERNEKMEKIRKDDFDGRMSQERLYNIITFCGERGTGKTSVMDSVVRALQSESKKYKIFIREYEKGDEKGRKRNAEISDLKLMLDENEFICLDGIDASLLEGKENILDVILSKMLQMLQRNTKGRDKNYLWGMEAGGSYSRGDIYRKFEEICQSRRKLLWRMDNPYEAGESSAEQLSNLAGSLDIREKLQELVPIYLQALATDNRKERQYLVINIDDLDIHNNAYQMLEQLHRYLMIPQVIIYIAVSEREIRAVCKKHFEGTYDSPAELAMSYLEKVLPYSRRIFLPATFSGDFFNIAAGENPELDDFLVKDYLLTEIAKRTHVFFDGKGLETHFYEIGNLRTLFNFYYLLEGMEKIEDEDLLSKKAVIFSKYQEILNSNFDKLKNDVIGRMATEKLNDDAQFRIFKEYYKEDFSSNGEYLVEQIIKIIGKQDFTEGYQVCGYCYGGVLDALYNLSKERQEFKPLIQCVLAMATIELTQNYIYTFYTSEISTKIKWREYISGSVCGNWGNRILPAVKGQNGKNTPIAYVKNRIVNIKIDAAIGEQGKYNQENVSQVNLTFDTYLEWIDESKLVESFELFMAFITKKSGLDKEIDGISMECPEEPKEKGLKIGFKLSDWECTFDVLGAVVNIIDYEGTDGVDYRGYFKKIRKMLLDMSRDYFSGKGEDLSAEQQEKLEKKMEERSLEKAYGEWDEAYGRIPLPLYSMDIMYNILKRVKRKMKKELPEVIGINDFLPTVKQFYKAIGEELRAEDEFYSKGKEGERKSYTNFYGGFCYYPFIAPFMEKMDDSGRKAKSIKAQQSDTLPELFVKLFNGFTESLIPKDE